ncbi:MAG: hypothetical protein U9R79_11830 [Armatimonadota bacterium]|nr:hypothetical protein [Armatimonadota bacterium]
MAGRPRGMTVLSYLTALTALCIAMGYLDAVTSFYLHGMLQVAHEGGKYARGSVEDMSPRVRVLEQTRQAAVVLVLLTIGIVAGRNGLQQAGTFVFALGGWGLMRYAAIRTITDWPGSLSDADVVLYLPRAIHAPVWMVMIVALGLSVLGVALIRGGAVAMRRARAG